MHGVKKFAIFYGLSAQLNTVSPCPRERQYPDVALTQKDPDWSKMCLQKFTLKKKRRQIFYLHFFFLRMF